MSVTFALATLLSAKVRIVGTAHELQVQELCMQSSMPAFPSSTVANMSAVDSVTYLSPPIQKCSCVYMTVYGAPNSVCM